MSEDEAKTMSCPTMTYCINELSVIQDGDAPLYAQGTCVGSACMAWRWFIDERPGGFCGLAGRPR